MRAVWLAGLGALIAVVAVTGVAEDSVLEGEAAGSAVSVERMISPQTVSISTDTVEVESWQAQSAATLYDLEEMPQNAHAITSSQTQIQLKTWSVPVIAFYGMFAVDDSTGDIYAVRDNRVQMVDVSENTRTEWIIPEDRVVDNGGGNNEGSIVVDGKYWFVDNYGYVNRLDPSTGIFTVWDVACNGHSSELVEYGQGNILCESRIGYPKPMIKLDPEQNEVTRVIIADVSWSGGTSIHVNSSGDIFNRGYSYRSNSGYVDQIIQINPTLDSAKVWIMPEDRGTIHSSYGTDDKVYFMKHFPNRQVLTEFDSSTDTLREWSLPYQTKSQVYYTSIVVDSNGVVFFEMDGTEGGLHRFVTETAEFTKFNVRPHHLVIDSSDTIYMNLSGAVAAAT